MRLLLTGLVMLLSAAISMAATLKATDAGVAIESPAGKFTLEYPVLLDSSQKAAQKLVGKAIEQDNKVKLTYDGGASIDLQILPDGTLAFTVSNIPSSVKNLRTQMVITPGNANGAYFSFGKSEAKPFPSEKPDKPHLFQGQSRHFTIRGKSGASVTFTTPYDYSYNQLTDNREWNWNVFMWQVHTPYNPDARVYTMKVADGTVDEQTPPTSVKPPAASSSGSAARPAPKPTRLALVNDGIRVEAGLLRFTMGYPELHGEGNKVAHKLIEKRISGGSAALKYADGGAIDVELKPNGQLTFKYSSIPSDVKNVILSSLIDFSISNGGTFSVDGQSAIAFPTEKPAKPHLFQGHARKIALKTYDGRTVEMALPEFTYVQMTDNREWGWKIFNMKFMTPFNRDWSQLRMQISMSDDASVKVEPQVDLMGQPAKFDYPGKMKSVDELKADAATEGEYYASFKPIETDAYGGLPGSGEKLGLTKTGFFHVEKKGDKWYLVNPEGNLFFHLGIGCFMPTMYTYVAGREEIYEWLPPRDGEFASAYRPNEPQSFDFHQANLIRKYGKPVTPEWFLELMIPRVKAFGFNSGGPFTSFMERQSPEANFPYVLTLPISQWRGFKMIPGVRETWDPYDPKMRETLVKNFKDIEKRANDPRVIGYFLVNEPLYEDLPRVVPTLDGKWHCKRELVNMLQKKYGTIAALNEAWNLSAASFDELIDRGLPVTTRQASADVREFTLQFLETYFELVTTEFRKVNKNHMLLGNRLQSGTINNEALCRLMGKYMDVISFNYYTYYLDKDFLQRIYNWTGKPMILSEFYYNSMKDTGLPGGVKDVNSQLERGLGYRNYVEQAASLGFIVGVEWFTLVDQSVTGNWFSKYNGENGNTGLFSVVDRPHKPMVEEMAKTNNRIYDVLLGKAEPFVYDDPRFSQRPAGAKMLKITRANGTITLDGTMRNWPGIPAEVISGKRLVDGSSAGVLEAAFKTCWDEQHLYVNVNVIDDTPMQNTNTPERIWSGDAVELFIGGEKVDEGGALLFTDRQVLLKASAEGEPDKMFYLRNAPEQTKINVFVTPSEGGYTIQAAIPWQALNITPREGVTFRFDLGVDDSADGSRRLRQIMWNGTNRNSGDRTYWGKAVLSQ